MAETNAKSPEQVRKFSEVKIRYPAYLKKRQDKLKTILEDPFFFESDVLIHELRVEIKKIRALMRLLHHTHHDEAYKKDFRKFRSLYQAAGEVRKTMLMKTRLIGEFAGQVPVSLLGELDRQCIASRRKLGRVFSAGTGNLVLGYAGELTDEISKLKPDQVIQFLDACRNEISSKGTGRHLKKVHIHSIRKQMKLYLAVSSMAGIDSGNVQLKKMAATAGNWHDAVELTTFLKEFAHAELISSGDREAVLKIAGKTKEDAESCLTEFLLLYSGFLQRDFI